MNWEIHRRLHGRGITQECLAALTGCGRSHLSQVLANKPGRGGHTRRKLFPHLMPVEIVLLGWEAEYTEWLKKGGKPAATVLKQSATENIVPAEVIL